MRRGKRLPETARKKNCDWRHWHGIEHRQPKRLPLFSALCSLTEDTLSSSNQTLMWSNTVCGAKWCPFTTSTRLHYTSFSPSLMVFTSAACSCWWRVCSPRRHNKQQHHQQQQEEKNNGMRFQWPVLLCAIFCWITVLRAVLFVCDSIFNQFKNQM